MAILFALATAAFAALALGLPGLVATVLAGYVVLVADLAGVTWLLSPFRGVTQWGLVGAQLVLLAAAASVWWLRGRPRPALAGARASLRELDWLTIAFLVVAAAALAYELVLALTVPPTNYDSLTYHLARVAAWKQAHGIHWIANAPTARMNEFQPLAEQEILFLFVATGTTVLYALPQYVAQLAILVAVYGVGRRLGFGVRACACAAAFAATLDLFALEATTAQNDLVSAAPPLIAVYFLLGGTSVEAVLAGMAAAIGLGVKLTTALVLPVVLWIAWQGGRRVFARFAVGGVAGFVAFSLWGYVLNIAHTGHVLGYGQGRVEDTVSPSLGTTIRGSAHVFYRLLELGRLSYWVVGGLGIAGVVVAVVAAARSRRLSAAVAGLPLLAPAIVLGLLSIHTGYDQRYVARDANEDYAAFGPVGGLAVAAACVLGLTVWRRDRRRLALALAVPSYVVLLAIYAKYNIWITRFLLVPVALVAPLFAGFFRRRLLTATIVVSAAVVVGLTLAYDRTKPLGGPEGRPWTLTQASALAESPAHDEGLELAGSIRAYAKQVPAGACVGAVLDPDEPSYLLFGPKLRHRVYFLPSLAALQTAVAENLSYVVISTGVNAPVADQFKAAGWRVGPLGPYWQLAAMIPPPRGCSSVG